MGERGINIWHELAIPKMYQLKKTPPCTRLTTCIICITIQKNRFYSIIVHTSRQKRYFWVVCYKNRISTHKQMYLELGGMKPWRSKCKQDGGTTQPIAYHQIFLGKLQKRPFLSGPEIKKKSTHFCTKRAIFRRHFVSR